MNHDEYIASLDDDQRRLFDRLFNLSFDEFKWGMVGAILQMKSWEDASAQIEVIHHFLSVNKSVDQLSQQPIFSNEPVDRCNTCLLVSYEFKFERCHKVNKGFYGLMCPRCGSLDIDDVDAD